VKWQYAGIIKPQTIIWLDTTVDFAIHNISKRLQKSTGKSDEAIEKIIESQIAYSQLLFDKQYEKNFGSVEVVIINNDGDIEQVVKNIKKVINKNSH
jgi:thymidylate kinase